MRNLLAKRNGEWLELDWKELAAFQDAHENENEDDEVEGSEQQLKLAQPPAGSHPHLVRQWLLAHRLFLEKWINRLFSVGGIRWAEGKLQLLAFSAIDPKTDPLYRKALQPTDAACPDVLYEDDYCVVLHKIAGMPVHESFPGERGTLDEAAARHMLQQGDPLPVRHIHRLDDDTSGPVLYAKNDLAQWKLDEAMRRKDIDRRYIAVVQGRVTPRSSVINLPIGKDRHHRARRRVTDKGEQAITHYEVIDAGAKMSVVRIRLETGRTHQIRVHMSHIGHPLIGDALYGGDAQLLTHQALHGERLIFPHPWTNDRIEAAAPWPHWLDQLADDVRSHSK